jgi:hypothetical protein
MVNLVLKYLREQTTGSTTSFFAIFIEIFNGGLG